MTFEGIEVAVNMVDMKGKVADRFETESIVSYTWGNWDLPLYEERLKQSYYILQEAFQ